MLSVPSCSCLSQLTGCSLRFSVAGIFGLVTYAESALQKLEREERVREGAIRKQARLELSRRGLVPTETAIAQWKDAHRRELAQATASEDTASQ